MMKPRTKRKAPEWGPEAGNEWRRASNGIVIPEAGHVKNRGAVEIFIDDGAVFSETENQPVSEDL